MTTGPSRARAGRLLGGVCAGLGRYLGLPPVFVRLFFVLLALSSDLGWLIYLLLWLILPDDGGRITDLRRNLYQAADELSQKALSLRDDLIEAPKNAFFPPSAQALIALGFAVLAFIGLNLLRIFPQIAVPVWLQPNTLWQPLLALGAIALIIGVFIRTLTRR